MFVCTVLGMCVDTIPGKASLVPLRPLYSRSPSVFLCWSIQRCMEEPRFAVRMASVTSVWFWRGVFGKKG